MKKVYLKIKDKEEIEADFNFGDKMTQSRRFAIFCCCGKKTKQVCNRCCCNCYSCCNCAKCCNCCKNCEKKSKCFYSNLFKSFGFYIYKNEL